MLVVAVFSWGIGQGAMADTTSQQDTLDYEHALKSAPPGIGLHQIFEVGQESQNNQVVATGAPGTDAVVITKGRNQLGKIWSTQDNLFDLKQDATASMWLYFGNNAATAADGMALVLQNDPRGAEAQSLQSPSGNETLAGESLNVWGVDKNPTQLTIAQSAIQRSWALEFDTNLNKSDNPGGADAFDKEPGLIGPHIASNYPGQEDSYHQYVKKSFLSRNRYYYGLNHQGILQPLKLADGAWHHLTLKWRHSSTDEAGSRNATYPQMTYIFDDKDPRTDEATPAQAKQKTVSIDPKIIDPENTGKCLWGFTGASGNQGANNLVIFENVPGLVDVEAQAHLQNLTTQQPLTAGQQVRRGDQVQLTYQATYDGGKQDWRNVHARLGLPAGLTFEKGEVQYASGTVQSLTAVDLAPSSLNLDLAQPLNTDNRWVKVTLTGHATAQQDTPLSVPSAKGTFTAVNGLATTGTPPFSLVPKFDLGLKLLTANSVETTLGQGVTLNAAVSGLPQEVLARQDLTLHPTINGQKRTPVALKQVTSAGKFSYALSSTELRSGSNTVEFDVTDSYGNRSNAVSATVTVKGTLSFKTLQTGTFQTAQLTGQPTTVSPMGDWAIQVSDTRQPQTAWKLQLAATPFREEATNRRLAGELVYRRTDRAEIPITETAQTVYQGSPQQDQDVTDVTASWQHGNGLHLRIGPAAFSGRYGAQLLWTLSNVP